MGDQVKGKRSKWVGPFIRQRREALSLSQRSLGLMFEPPVTTQFISNVERGVTPLPPGHVPTLARALQVSEQELMAHLEKEYSAKLSGKLGLGASESVSGSENQQEITQLFVAPPHASPSDVSMIRDLYDAYCKADVQTKQAFTLVCEDLLKIQRKSFQE